MMNEEIIGDLSTIDGLSIYGEDLELNMQERYKGDDMDLDSDWDNFEYYHHQIRRQQRAYSYFSEFNDDLYEEDKISPLEEEKVLPREPPLHRGPSYPSNCSF